jgi:hypothetical protein
MSVAKLKSASTPLNIVIGKIPSPVAGPPLEQASPHVESTYCQVPSATKNTELGPSEKSSVSWPLVEASAASYMNEFTRVEVPTVVDVITTFPVTGALVLAADTITESAVCERIAPTSTPASVTDVMSVPDPIRHPVIATVPQVL